METSEDSYYTEIPRSLSPQDQKLMIQLEKDAFPGIGAVDEQTLVPLARYGKIIFYREKGDPVPVAVCELMRDYYDREKAYIFGYYVRSDKKGAGLGRRFMEEVHRILRQDGFSKACLTVSIVNRPAVALYEKSGYVTRELRPDEYGTGEDRFYMEKSL
ncbi:GNAT family N-acetyltransferase [Peribacillus sp. SCS-37]|uniref:GNAT family N-acetyltransferase n=1 Tax=Paraperibacillus esterisolvens TaxID=3115296 RepID=UPI003905FA6E